MIRIIFDNGELMECEHINKIYIDAKDADKIYIADKTPKENKMPWYMNTFNMDKINNMEETHD